MRMARVPVRKPTADLPERWVVPRSEPVSDHETMLAKDVLQTVERQHAHVLEGLLATLMACIRVSNRADLADVGQ